jgi:hypothetical protein
VCSRQRTVVRSLEFQSRAELISDDIDHVLIALFRDPGAPDDFKIIQVFVAQMIPKKLIYVKTSSEICLKGLRNMLSSFKKSMNAISTVWRKFSCET